MTAFGLGSARAATGFLNAQSVRPAESEAQTVGVAKTSAAPLIEPPKQRHSVTPFQGLDLRVTILFVTPKSASYLL